MASIRRTDIMNKKHSKGRPAKSEREKIYKRQEAYKWRDARRIYLAGSFDRWRKLRSSLKLKDSSLAWHLMEAHEKGNCTFCRHSNTDITKEREKQRIRNHRDFLPSLTASIRQLCYAHFDFNESIDVVGLLCLEFDKARKENFSLNECIRSGMKTESHNLSSQEIVQQSLQGTGSSPSLSSAHPQEVQQIRTSEYDLHTAQLSNSTAGTVNNDHPNSAGLSEKLKQQLETCGQENFDILCAAASMPIERVAGVLGPLTTSLSSTGTDKTCSDVTDKTDVVVEMSPLDTEEPNDRHVIDTQRQFREQSLIDSSLCSESEPSLEIDIEKMDTSQEEEKPVKETRHHLSPKLNSDLGHESSSEAHLQDLEGKEPWCNKDSTLFTTNFKHENVDPETKSENIDLPLDMSVLKSNVKKEIDTSINSISIHDFNRDTPPPGYMSCERTSLESAHLSSAGKRKITDTNSNSSQNSRKSPFWLEGFQGLPGKMKEEGHTSIPWQRRDMSRKEEYEYLEMNPFSDLADFSQRYPHVHQRTYYRWKRRIKEEYIILEQCPSMSYQEFSSAVLQAKESVFCHWKSLIAQGKGFFAPSDTTKRLEAKCSLKSNSPQNSAYAFVQKNLSYTYEQFCQQYPGTPLDVFNVLKRKAMQEFWLFHQNQHMSHEDFSKLVNISEDVYNMWKKYVECFRSNAISPNLKPASNSISPNPHVSMSSFHSLDSSHSSTADISTKESQFRIKDNSTAFKESKSTVPSSVLNSHLTDSVARSLSSSYLASLQNMMFPWHTYYGMASPLSQQMLPMMLWPGMMGLTSGLTSSLGLMTGPRIDDAHKPSASVVSHNSLLGNSSEIAESIKPDESHSSHSDDHVHSSKRLANAEIQELTRNQAASLGEKRQKVSNDKDDTDLLNSVNRSRKQNKQEYIYYLKNPALCFKELESLFPSISLRTFYRWRKEMNAAVLLLEDNKNMTFHQFQLVFPDIPEDIFESWKEKVSNGLSPPLVKQAHESIGSEELNCSGKNLLDQDEKCSEQTKSVENLATEALSHHPITSSNQGEGRYEGAHPRKNVKESYLYVQKNPHIDFVSFSRIYPQASVRSFYRWKKELKDAISFLRANPTIAYDDYKSVDASVSEEVFNVWKSLALDSHILKEEITEKSSPVKEKEAVVTNHSSRKFTGPEYWFLQYNPYIEFSQFTRTYPDVSKRTFYRWKQEIQQIINYIQSDPSVQFADIAAVLPQVSEDAFAKWKENFVTKKDSCVESKNMLDSSGATEVKDRPEVGYDTKSQMTEALLYLMHNPTVKYSQFRDQYDFVSLATFQLWLHRIKTVILFIASNPNIDYPTFSSSIKDVAEVIFEIWKNLNSEDIATLEENCEAPEADAHVESKIISDSQKTVLNITQKAFEFCQKNPKISFTDLQTKCPTVPAEFFSDWISRIQEERSCIRENPDLMFDDFAKMYPNTKQEIFDLWKSDVSSSQIQHFLHEPSVETMQEDKAVDGNLGNGESKPHNLCTELKENSKSQKEGMDPYSIVYMEDKISDNEVTSLNVKENVHNEPKEFLLNKLAKLADSGAAVCSQNYVSRTSFEHLLKNNNNKTIKMETFSSIDVDGFLTGSNSPVAGNHQQSRKDYTSDVEAENVYCSSPIPAMLQTSSLSALMAMTSDDSRNQASSPQRDYSRHNISPLCSGIPNWQRTSNGSGSFSSCGATKDDDEAFSSQRQKKMSRAEYLFVKDNPDVDSQEFSRIFPGVSARTFYRWKKEIKAQLHMA